MTNSNLWWLSFASSDLPKGEQFLGGLVIAGPDFLSAVQNARLCNLNPGGEVHGIQVPRDVAARIKPKWRNKLLTRQQCAEFDAEMEAKP